MFLIERAGQNWFLLAVNDQIDDFLLTRIADLKHGECRASCHTDLFKSRESAKEIYLANWRLFTN